MDTVINRYHQNGNAEKILGAVYTPPRVATALVRWAVRSPDDKVLDPACGEGVFLASARTHLANLGSKYPTCLGVDIDPQAASASLAICSDFFEWAKNCSTRFDAIVGNPPFVRSHLFSETSRAIAFQQMEEMGLHPSRLMSTWAPFIALSCKLLAPNGRLAFVVPEEILHVGYAEKLRTFLLKRFRQVTVCLPEDQVFPSVQQSVILLLCENKTDEPAGLFTISFGRFEEGPSYATEPAPAWEWHNKWTHVFLSDWEREAVAEAFSILRWKPLKDYGRVEVGVVTGYNDFFVLPRSKAKQISPKYLTPIVASARDLKGIRLASSDFTELVEGERPAFLLHTTSPIEKLPKRVRDYLARGEEMKVNQRFKCRNREPWYGVPSVWPADALLLRQVGEIPKLVHLSKKCTSTDTIHRVTWLRPSLGRQHTAGFLNTWTLIACEIMGRSYGGGVLELMPSEANNIPVPPPLPKLETVFDSVDEAIRGRRFDRATQLVDNVVISGLMTRRQQRDARDILARLIDRRKSKGNGLD